MLSKEPRVRFVIRTLLCLMTRKHLPLCWLTPLYICTQFTRRKKKLISHRTVPICFSHYAMCTTWFLVNLWNWSRRDVKNFPFLLNFHPHFVLSLHFQQLHKPVMLDLSKSEQRDSTSAGPCTLTLFPGVTVSQQQVTEGHWLMTGHIFVFPGHSEGEQFVGATNDTMVWETTYLRAL